MGMTKDINRGMEALWKYVRSLGRLNNIPGWIGLDQNELNREANLSVDYYTFKAGALWAEQRLKEKNHGN
jgi:hypothetical protein